MKTFVAKLSGVAYRFRRTAKFRGSATTDGECDPPDRADPEIRINPRLRGRKELETYLHEMRHANHWQLDEDVVTEACRDEAAVLWRLGYRRVANPKGET